MRSIALLVVLVISNIALADSFYVRKTSLKGGVEESQSAPLRSFAATALKADPKNKLVKSPDQAESTYRVLAEKNDQGYLVQLEIYRNHRLVDTKKMVAQNTSGFEDVIKKLVEEARSSNTSQTEKRVTEVLPTRVENKSSVEERGEEASAVVANAEQAPTDSKKPIAKTWGIALGPIISNTLTGTSSSGTNYAVALAYNQAIAERIDLQFLYDANFNTANQGSTPVATMGIKANFFLNDRLATSTPYLGLDIGYGGANRFEDAAATGALSIGYDFFRTTDFVFEVQARHIIVNTTSAKTRDGGYPAIDQITFGIYF
jgi:hypothetical protein